ncbi:hypothetical protein GCM10011416_21490 [Polaribacter pacificus]|uniref:DUF1573 domain-containing protein n=1 Tax=Polaribacter pacificus TaxID=1775173 RepID=A0A917I1C9_9FLAO|nr:DUF1573 domain-containing protein [Polaribacter pacificus]GGH02453.1 hypothetical protein GCM10011416_21490 [Polaribacter pacificus]
MKKLIFLSIFYFCTFSFFAQEKKLTGPVFKFDKELINYGKVDYKSEGKRVFTFKNVGTEPIIITDIKTSCDCTVPSKPDKPIMPNEKGSIEVVYDTSKSGGFSKVITIFSNAKNGRVMLRIKGFVAKK